MLKENSRDWPECGTIIDPRFSSGESFINKSCCPTSPHDSITSVNNSNMSSAKDNQGMQVGQHFDLTHVYFRPSPGEVLTELKQTDPTIDKLRIERTEGPWCR